MLDLFIWPVLLHSAYELCDMVLIFLSLSTTDC